MEVSPYIHIAQVEKKELDNLLHILGENRLPLCKVCLEGMHTTILQDIETKIKNVNGPDMIWTRVLGNLPWQLALPIGYWTSSAM